MSCLIMHWYAPMLRPFCFFMHSKFLNHGSKHLPFLCSRLWYPHIQCFLFKSFARANFLYTFCVLHIFHQHHQSWIKFLYGWLVVFAFTQLSHYTESLRSISSPPPMEALYYNYCSNYHPRIVSLSHHCFHLSMSMFIPKIRPMLAFKHIFFEISQRHFYQCGSLIGNTGYLTDLTNNFSKTEFFQETNALESPGRFLWTHGVDFTLKIFVDLW